MAQVIACISSLSRYRDLQLIYCCRPLLARFIQPCRTKSQYSGRYAFNIRWVQQLQVQLQEQSVQSMSSDIELSFMTNIVRCSGESTSIRYTVTVSHCVVESRQIRRRAREQKLCSLSFIGVSFNSLFLLYYSYIRRTNEFYADILHVNVETVYSKCVLK